jgi:hypothetical protein
MVAAFWHMWWIAGVALLVSGFVGVMVHAAGYIRLEQDQLLAPKVPGPPAAIRDDDRPADP